jgi:LmbE family N-acetylglucosaminyl deacetylase
VPIEQPLRILVIGAHPDDADIKAGGSSAKWSAAGHTVKLVSLCDGSAGHQTIWGAPLAERRRAEAQAAARVIGVTYEILSFLDGELQPTLEARRQVIRLIRNFRPDLLLTHRPTDYHPDHCYTGQLVQEAAYMVTVPGICPETPHLPRSPVIMHVSDAFTKPCRFEPSVVVDIGDEMEKVVGMLHCHASQFYEWIPYNAGYLDQVPKGDKARREWLLERFRRRVRPLARRYRGLVEKTYGSERAARIEYIEAFEISEYGAPLDAESQARLFPFLPKESSSGSTFVRKEWLDIPEED